METFGLENGGSGSLEVPALRRNNVEGKESMFPGSLKMNEPVWRRHVLFLPLLLRVLHPCLDWDEVELAP